MGLVTGTDRSHKVCRPRGRGAEEASDLSAHVPSSCPQGSWPLQPESQCSLLRAVLSLRPPKGRGCDTVPVGHQPPGASRQPTRNSCWAAPCCPAEKSTWHPWLGTSAGRPRTEGAGAHPWPLPALWGHRDGKKEGWTWLLSRGWGHTNVTMRGMWVCCCVTLRLARGEGTGDRGVCEVLKHLGPRRKDKHREVSQGSRRSWGQEQGPQRRWLEQHSQVHSPGGSKSQEPALSQEPSAAEEREEAEAEAQGRADV